MKAIIASLAFGACILLPATNAAIAGQPNASCETPGLITPGHAGSASNTGSPFSPNGHSGTVYAGSDGTASLAHANSPNAVSQYDIACVHATQAQAP